MTTKRKTPTTSSISKPSTSAPKRATRSADLAVAPGEIAQRAYAKFLSRGGSHGNHVEDWLAAEAELRAELG